MLFCTALDVALSTGTVGTMWVQIVVIQQPQQPWHTAHIPLLLFAVTAAIITEWRLVAIGMRSIVVPLRLVIRARTGFVWRQECTAQNSTFPGTGEFQHQPWLPLSQLHVIRTNALHGRPGCHAACSGLCAAETLRQTSQNGVLEARIMLPWHWHPGAIVQVGL